MNIPRTRTFNRKIYIEARKDWIYVFLQPGSSVLSLGVALMHGV